MSADTHVECTAHLDIVNVEDTVVSFVLVPPIRQTVCVLVNVETVNERISIAVNIPLISTVVRRPAREEEPVEFRNVSCCWRVGSTIITVVINHHVREWVVPENHSPVGVDVGGVILVVATSVKRS